MQKENEMKDMHGSVWSSFMRHNTDFLRTSLCFISWLDWGNSRWDFGGRLKPDKEFLF